MRASPHFHVLSLLCLVPGKTIARSWKDIKLINPGSSHDFHVNADSYEVDPFTGKVYAQSGIPSPTANTSHPTNPSPTTQTFHPTSPSPTTRSFHQPNAQPTRIPFNRGNIFEKSNSPTVSVNSSSPAVALSDSTGFPANPVPLHPSRGYFNYDVRNSSRYGPGYPALVQVADSFEVVYKNNGWKYVQNPKDFYWEEFSNNGFGAWKGALGSTNFSNNQCGNVGQQSPIDVRMSGVACIEHHQIRTHPGDFRVNGEHVEKRIEANKLRIIWPRRPCGNLMATNCSQPDPPHADFPGGWAGFADMMNTDIKIPSEHRIYGQTYDAEMQLYHVHAGRQRIAAISVLIQTKPGGHNDYFQDAINAFQYQADSDRAQCANKIQNNRQMIERVHRSLMGENATTKLMEEDFESWARYSTLLADPGFLKRGKEYNRILSEIWNPYDPALIPTFWFYGYEGSLTEPPCTEVVSWFVMDTPMTISPQQLDQMKTILFTHVDPECNATSTQFAGSVARPIQESHGRQVWKCTRKNFIPDAERMKSS